MQQQAKNFILVS